MSGAGSRRKGAAAERELFEILNQLLGWKAFKRNLVQSRVGGADSEDNDALPCAIEVKRQETWSLGVWLKQAEEQAAKLGKYPVLAFRSNQEPWRVLVEMTPQQFANWIDLMGAPPGGKYKGDHAQQDRTPADRQDDDGPAAPDRDRGRSAVGGDNPPSVHESHSRPAGHGAAGAHEGQQQGPRSGHGVAVGQGLPQPKARTRPRHIAQDHAADYIGS